MNLCFSGSDFRDVEDGMSMKYLVDKNLIDLVLNRIKTEVEGTDYITITDFDTKDVCIERKPWTDFLDKLKKIRQLMKDNPEKAKKIIYSLKNPTPSTPPPLTPSPKPPTTPSTPPPLPTTDQGWFNNFRIFEYLCNKGTIKA